MSPGANSAPGLSCIQIHPPVPEARRTGIIRNASIGRSHKGRQMPMGLRAPTRVYAATARACASRTICPSVPFSRYAAMPITSSDATIQPSVHAGSACERVEDVW